MGIWYGFKGVLKKNRKPDRYDGECPPFFELEGAEWFDQLNAMLPEIKSRVLEMMNSGRADLPQYHANMLHKGIWESQAFLVCNVQRELASGAGKRVYELFRDIPGGISLFISILKPHTHVKAHNGDTDASYRLHIPVVIPSGLPACGIKVGGVERQWQKNEILAFCDAHMHEVWNYTDEARIILILDVVRPEYLSSTRAICNNVLFWLLLQRMVELPGIKLLPFYIKVPCMYVALQAVKPFLSLLQRRPK